MRDVDSGNNMRKILMDNKDISFDIYQPFGPSILKTKLPQAYVDALNQQSNKILNNSNLILRICKGIYNEDSRIAFKDRNEINKNFKHLIQSILRGKGYACIATHDIDLIEEIEEWIEDKNISTDRFEFQVLYGVPMSKTLNRLKSKGYKITVYVPFGSSWYDYSIRRLKENPKIISYVIKNIFKK